MFFQKQIQVSRRRGGEVLVTTLTEKRQRDGSERETQGGFFR
jgi:hypothetical protein